MKPHIFCQNTLMFPPKWMCNKQIFFKCDFRGDTESEVFLCFYYQLAASKPTNAPAISRNAVDESL